MINPLISKIQHYSAENSLTHLIAVYGSATVSTNGIELELDSDLLQNVTTWLAGAGRAVINGGYMGTMSSLAKSVITEGGTAIGITANDIFDPCEHRSFSMVFEANNHWERLSVLVDVSNLYLLLPGGIGTLTELSATLWSMDRGFIPSNPILILGKCWQNQVALLRQNRLSFKSSNTINLIVEIPDFQSFITWVSK